jgi:hypothetical protein
MRRVRRRLVRHRHLHEGTETYVYAQNFESEGEAKTWGDSFWPAEKSISIDHSACNVQLYCRAMYLPVCGQIANEPAQTFSNGCSFYAAVRMSAGDETPAGSKGFYVAGECPAAVCNYEDPTRSYVAQSKDQCALVKFFCAEGEPFFDDCGCGCTVP